MMTRPKFLLVFLCCFFSLWSNTTLQASIGIIEIKPRVGLRCNGAIEIQAGEDPNNAEPGQSAGPFEVYLEDEDEFYFETGVNGTVSFSGLCGGDYTITVYDLFGCETVMTATVEVCGLRDGLRLVEKVNATGPGKADGSLTVAPPSVGETYTFRWSTGQTGPTLNNVESGQYAVTATSASGCTTIGSFEVSNCYLAASSGDCYTVGPQDDLEEICEYPETEPNWVSFEAKIELENGGLILEGQQTIECRVLVKEANNPIFTTPASATYSIKWKVNGHDVDGNSDRITLDVNEWLSIGGGSFGVTATVSNGCTNVLVRSDQIFQCGEDDNALLSDLFTEIIEQPCDIINDQSGIYEIIIPNPNDEVVSLTINGEDQSIDDTGDPIIKLFTSVAAGNYSIDISIGDCMSSFVFHMPIRSAEKTFLRFENDICYFDQSCKELDLGEIGEPADFNTNHASTFPCGYPVFCGGQEIEGEFRDVDKRYGRALKYLYALAILGNSGVFDEEYFKFLVYSYSGVFSPCTRVKWCPASMKITSVVSGPWDGIPSYNSIKSPQEGCVSINCSIFGISNHVEVCADEIASFFPPQITERLNETVLECAPQSINYFELLRAYENNSFDDMILEEGVEFSDTDVGKIISDYEMYGVPDGAKCATIVFCINDLSIIHNDLASVQDYCGNLVPSDKYCNSRDKQYRFDHTLGLPFDRISCENPAPQLAPSNTYDGTIRDENGEIVLEEVMCPLVPSDPNTCYEAIELDYGYFLSFGESEPLLSTSELNTKALLKYDDSSLWLEEMEQFGLVKADNRYTPLGIFRTPSTASKDEYISSIYHYSHDGKKIMKDTVGQLRLIIHDWDTQSVLSCDSIADDADTDQELRIYFENDQIGWSRNITSDDELLPLFLDKDTSNAFLGGICRGNILYQTSSLFSSTLPTAFILKSTLDGSSYEFYTLEGIDNKKSDLQFSRMKNNEVLISGRYQGGQLTANGNIWNMNHHSGFFVALMNTQGQFTLLQDLSANINSRLLAADFSDDGTQFTIVYENPPIPGIQSNHELMVKTFNISGNELWNKFLTFETEKLNTKKIALTYGENDKVFLGLTYQNGFNAFDSVLVSRGGEDIALVEFNGASGERSDLLTFGSVDNENVSHFLYSDGALFFGGEMQGKERQREIGYYNFVNLGASLQRTYISYVFDREPTAPQATNYTNLPIDTETQSVTTITQKETFKAYPNPFNRTLNIEINSRESRPVVIQLTDLLGKTVYRRSNELVEAGTTQISLNILADLPEGVYTLRINGEDGTSFGSRRVVHMSGN
ncbi:MAG: T9SS type A sorting domain-containing protein [Saprospiraceae bacterium]